jgi:hypothetical protein
MAERPFDLPGRRRRGRYEDWERVQGIPEQNALDEARRRDDARDDAQRIKAAGGFDADLFFGTPSYATGGAAGRHAVAKPAPNEQDESDDG